MIIYAKQTLDESGATPVFTYDFDVDVAWVLNVLKHGKCVVLCLPSFEGSETVKPMPEQLLPVIGGNNIADKITFYTYNQAGGTTALKTVADNSGTNKIRVTINGANVA